MENILFYKKPIYLFNSNDIKNNIILNESQESIVLDFKKELNLSIKKEEVATEFALDICQFVNTWGGCIIIGVEEGQIENSSFKVAKKFVNIPNIEEIKRFFNDKVHKLLYPNIIQFDINGIKLNEINIICINIYPLTDGLGCVYNISAPDIIKYPYRTDYGKKYYKPYEIEEKMNSKNRSLILKLNELICIGKEIKLLSNISKEQKAPDLTWDNREINVYINNIGNHEVQLKINDLVINIPYGMINEVWRTEDNKIGLILNCKLIISCDRKKIIMKI